ncbi:MAG TPA: hypothetical protein VKA60_16190 [Blastocatellia bacterium]|nr:hypothetical protein [Blastocatellia bacterium]
MLPEKSLKPSDLDLAPIRKLAADAIEEMFKRAVQNDPADPDIQDAKDEVKDNKLLPNGPLQDCEFGMALLLVRDWLGEGFFASVERDKFAKAIPALVERTVKRLLLRNQSDRGGGGEHAAFFTGEPYTEYARGKNFSANLDAAMITLAFLAPAVTQLNEQLAGLDHNLQPNEVALPDWVKNLRDAALYVILDGLNYAKQCRVVHDKTFLGFTCDPESNAQNPKDGGLSNDEDRLFFTWTACETINDMIVWRDGYLMAQLPTPPPAQAVTRLTELINDLRGTLLDAAQWCQGCFLERFEAFEPRETKEIVREVERLRVGAALEREQSDRVKAMAGSVQHVYHLSQYAAIRSLVPERITPKEVRTLIEKLDPLVTKFILLSGLDDAEHAALYRSLTREYSLGSSNQEPYKDDAWYPLVVRSLSGLLSRTLNDIGTQVSRSEALALTLTFQRSLESHVKNMIERRPKGGESGPDGRLWSFAADQPYVLYATLRTIFALIKYEEFLVAVDKFQREEPDAAKKEEELAMILGRQFADYFRPAIKEMVAQFSLVAVEPRTVPSAGRLDIALPDEPWAADALYSLLAHLVEDFKRSRVAQILPQRAQQLILARDTAVNNPTTEGMPRTLQAVKNRVDEILKFPQAGEQLAKLETWDARAVTGVLFENLLEEYFKHPNRSFSDLLNPLDPLNTPAELLKLIEKARVAQDTFNKK